MLNHETHSKGAKMNLRLQELRKAAGYRSRALFADAFGTTERQVKSWEIGERKVSLDTACELADFFNCSLDELAGREEYVGTYSDARQAEINRDYGVLDEPSKDAAAAALRGMAAACAQAIGPQGFEARKRTA